MRRGGWLSALITTIALGGCGREAPPAPPLTPVVVQPAGSHVEASGVRYAAAIEPNLRVDLAVQGRRLRAGSAAGARRRRAPARRAGGRLRLAGHGPGDAARRRITWRSAIRRSLSSARGRSSLDYANQEFERAERLFTTKSLTKADYDGAKTKVDVIRAKIDGARALVQEADNAIADAALKAPIDGLVLKRLVEVGSLAGPGTPGFVLGDSRQRQGRLRRARRHGAGPEGRRDADRSRRRRCRASVSRSDHPHRSGGRSAQPGLRRRSDIPNPDNSLKIGMVAALRDRGGVPASAPVVVPIASVIRSRKDPNGYAVVVVEDRSGQQIAQSRDVRLGQTFGNTIEVTEGLKPGERVIVSGATIVTDGERVRIAQP